MTLWFATQAYLHDDCPNMTLNPPDGQGHVDAPPSAPCHPTAALENPPPRAPRATAVAFPLNPAPKPPSGKATLGNPAPVAPQGKAVDTTTNPPPKAPGGGKAEDV